MFSIQHALALGLIANVRHYSGAMFQVVGHVQKKRKNITEVLAAGGRYDGMIAQFQKPGSTICHCVVGISIAMERVTAAVSEDKDSGLSIIDAPFMVKTGFYLYGSFIFHLTTKPSLESLTLDVTGSRSLIRVMILVIGD